jgi:DNA-binding NarL/FixJ family response regulator
MFDKVLISDDLGSINKGVLSVIHDLGIENVHQVQYCDDAYLKIKRSVIDKSPFDLLITDLSFEVDHRKQKFTSGEELIAALKKDFPNLKIIAYSVEDRLQKVRKLIHNYGIEAYVCKGRNGLIELKLAIQKVYENEKFLSPQILNALDKKGDLDIDDFDIELVKLLSSGLSQEDISHELKSKDLAPNSLSSIEKRLNKLRIQFRANNAIHLVSIVKDLGLI